MQVDSFTVLLFGLLIKLVLGGLFAGFWFNSRGAPWFGWWGAALAAGSLTAGLYMLRPSTSSFLVIGVGNALFFTAFACLWQGARAFERRPPLWLAVAALPAVWLAACLIPGFIDSVHLRIIVSSIIVSAVVLATALEFWRGREEALASRWPVIGVCLSAALIFAARIPLMAVLPFPFGVLPAQPGSIGAFNLTVIAHTLLLVVLFVAMSKERLELEQRTKAQTDPLTGALNRRAFMVRGERLLVRHRHEGAPLALLFLDLDHFKSLNDRFGHSGGDDVLTCFVGLVNSCIRPTDFLFRIGGEEFCCLLPHTGTEQAHLIAERIRHQVETAAVIVTGMPAKTTVSIGVASTEVVGYDLDALIRHADGAVYAAKRTGRNRVVMADAAHVLRLAVGAAGAWAR